MPDKPRTQFEEWWISVGWDLLGCPAKFSEKYFAAKLTFEALVGEVSNVG